MTKYTIEDIEILRQKSDLSYEEAIDLLEYHNGSLPRALVDLERNGKIKSEQAKPVQGKKNGLMAYLYQLRVIIYKGSTVIANVSSIFAVVLLLLAWHICLIAAILCFLLGYRIKIAKNAPGFDPESIHKAVSQAKNNVQKTVSSISGQFSASQTNPQTDRKPMQHNDPFSRNESPANRAKPVNIQFPDGGSVDVRDDGDGYHEAEIR